MRLPGLARPSGRREESACLCYSERSEESVTQGLRMPHFVRHDKGWHGIAALALSALLLASCGGAATPASSAPASPSAPAKPAASTAPASASAQPATSTAASAAAKPAASGAAASPGASGALDKVTIAYVPTTAEAGLLVTVNKGYAKQYGIDAQLVRLNSGPDILPQVGTGQIDAAGIGITAGVFSAVARGVGMRLVADLAAYPKDGNPLPFLVLKAVYDPGQVKSAKELKGHKIAMNAPGGINEYQWIKLLAKYNLTLDDVQTTVMGIPDEIVALKNGAIDASILAEPNGSEAVNNGYAVMVPEDSNPVPGVQGTFLVFSSKMMQERPDVARRFMMGYVKGVRDVVAHPDAPDTIKIQSDVLGFSEAVIRQQLGASAFLADPKVDLDSIIGEQDAFFKRGEMKEMSAPLPVDKLVDSSFLDAALKALGPAS